MTIATNTGYLRPFQLQGAAKTAKTTNVRKLVSLGLLRDNNGNKYVLLDLIEVEQRLKERGVRE